jgi:TonB-linked SusC/RagA family outer membrane protein
MKRYIFKLFLLLIFTVFISTQVEAQEKGTSTPIQGKILDEAGNPIPLAKIYFDSGSKIALTNADGSFSVAMPLSEIAVLEATDFETVRMDGAALKSNGTVVLVKKAYGLKSTDKVNVPFGTLYSRQLTGAVTVINTKETMKFDKTEYVKGVVNGRVLGFFGNSNSRSNTDVYSGILNDGGNTITVVDGIPRVGYNLNLSEVESITVLKDITTRALYGAQAMDGVILITTKRGEANKREMNFSVERGISDPIALPEFMNAGDYMGFFNQALKNDGLPEKYSADAIAKTLSGEDKLRYPDEDYYNSTYLKNLGSFTNVIGEASGGNTNAQYYLNMGWKNNTGLIQKLWKEKYTDGTNTFNVRGNVDYQINSFMKMKIDGVVFYETSNTPRFNAVGTTAQNFYMRASSFLPNYYPALIDASLLSPDQQGAAKLIDGKYVLGGTSEYQTNIYGELATNGYYTETTRILQNNTSLDFDLKGITEGLTAKAYLTFDMNNNFAKSLARTYAVYQPNYTIPAGQTAEVLSFTKYGVDKPAETPNISNVGFYRRVSVSGQVNYDREFNKKHKINATGVAYTDFQTLSGRLQDEKSVNFGIRANYMLKDKYIAELSVVTSGSPKFDDNKWGTSPSFGLGWIVSEESFLKGNDMINYLKLRANAGTLKTDQYSAYRQYMSYYTGGANADYYNYGFGAFRNYQRTINAGNPNISWTEKKEMSFGFESVLLKGKMQLEATYFNNTLSGIPQKLTNILPGYVEQTWQNYGEYNDKGIEWGLKYNINLGKALLTLGHNAVYSTPTKVKDNVIDYAEPWRKRTGIDADAIFGLEDNGFYTTSDFSNGTLVSGLPVPIFGEVKPGDIKYIDQNNDSYISDKDEKMIGNSSARLQYGLNINLKVKNFELFVLGTGQNGAERIYSKPYDWVYGDRKYSEVVRNSWTESTAATADYPRLSSKNNPNNFRNSTFWLKKDNFFTIHTAQLTYNMPFTAAQKAAMKTMQLYVRGTNLLTISENKERRELNTDSQPQMRFYSIGVVTSF